MCLILDANRFSDALKKPTDPRYVPLFKWLRDDAGMLVFGGTKYRAEIGRVGAAQRFFAEYSRAGKAHSEDDAGVDKEEAVLISADSLASDDPHIIALARKTGARTVCTEDIDLMADVKNKSFLDRPRGRIYQDASHVNLLHHDPGCPHPP